jgi:gibberellin 20-oxidase
MALVFDAAALNRKADIPEQFVWPAEEAPAVDGVEEIAVPVVDLAGFLAGGGDGDALRELAAACERHGFFQVVNHGVDPALLAEAYRCCDAFYAQPIHEKQRAQRRPGENYGYAGSFVGRFNSKLPWKETMSFNCSDAPENARMVVDYFVAVLGEEYRHMGYVRTYLGLVFL